MKISREEYSTVKQDQRLTSEGCPHWKELRDKAEFRSALHMLHAFTIQVSVESAHQFEKGKQHSIFMSCSNSIINTYYAPTTHVTEVKADNQTEKEGKCMVNIT